MLSTRFRLLLAVTVVITASGVQKSWADDLRVTLPRYSQATPVQRLNREGVDAIRKQQYEKAEALFDKAYLFDPADPFTLNNLGYISELQGELGRAQKFYALASEQGGDAFVDRSNAKQLEGKPLSYALNSLKEMCIRDSPRTVLYHPSARRARNPWWRWLCSHPAWQRESEVAC